MDDAELVRAFRKGDREAFSELVGRHWKPLTMLIMRIVRDGEAAKDISQTAFLKAFDGLPRFMMGSSFKTWLYRIAMNAVKDHLRRRKPESELPSAEDIVDPAMSPAESYESGLRRGQLQRAIEELPDKQRLTLQLRIYEELDYKRIARILGGTAAGARANFFQATKSLRESLGKHHEND